MNVIGKAHDSVQATQGSHARHGGYPRLRQRLGALQFEFLGKFFKFVVNPLKGIERLAHMDF